MCTGRTKSRTGQDFGLGRVLKMKYKHEINFFKNQNFIYKDPPLPTPMCPCPSRLPAPMYLKAWANKLNFVGGRN